MKKTIKATKLNLNKTTLRMLCGSDLKDITGGLAASECGSCNSCPEVTCSACPTGICPVA